MKRRDLLRSISALGAAAYAGCGKHSSVTGPSGSNDPQPVSVVSGRTEQPVSSLAGLTARPGQQLDLQAAGYFTFRTAFNGASIALWPADDGYLAAGHTRRLVYRTESPGKLYRLPVTVSRVSLMPDEGIQAFPWALERVRRATDALSRTHASLDFDVSGAGFPVQLAVNFADPGFVSQPGAAALAYTSNDAAGTITGVRIVFRSLQIQGFWYTEDNFQCAVTHETLHGTGLDHSDTTAGDAPGIMSLGADSYRFLEPSAHEQLIMAMQYRRLPGNTLTGMTESDPGISAKSEGRQTGWRLVCAR